MNLDAWKNLEGKIFQMEETDSKHIRKCGTQSGQNDEMTSNSIWQKCRKGREPA